MSGSDSLKYSTLSYYSERYYSGGTSWGRYQLGRIGEEEGEKGERVSGNGRMKENLGNWRA